MSRTYTPGYSGIKAILTLCGVALLGLGLLQNIDPLKATFLGTRAHAKVLRTERLNADTTKEIFTTAQNIPSDNSRSAVFSYWIEIETPEGGQRPAKLAVAHQTQPAYLPGDTVAVGYQKQRPEVVYALYDWSTWALGAFLSVCGLVFTGSFVYLLIHARTPIAIPEDTPEDVAF